MFETPFNPSSKSIQTGRGALVRQSVRISQGSSCTSTQRTNSVASSELVLNQVPTPDQVEPDCWKAMCRALHSFSSFGRKTILPLIRKNGCHWHLWMASNSQLAYKPRSAAGRTCQVTGIAQPRYTTLITKTTRTCPRRVPTQLFGVCSIVASVLRQFVSLLPMR